MASCNPMRTKIITTSQGCAGGTRETGVEHFPGDLVVSRGTVRGEWGTIAMRQGSQRSGILEAIVGVLCGVVHRGDKVVTSNFVTNSQCGTRLTECQNSLELRGTTQPVSRGYSLPISRQSDVRGQIETRAVLPSATNGRQKVDSSKDSVSRIETSEKSRS